MNSVTNPFFENSLKFPFLRINTNRATNPEPQQSLDYQSYLDITMDFRLSDLTKAALVLERIASDRHWTKAQIDNDLSILKRNRLFTVQDLRALSDHSWLVIELLPLVKDLLREAIDPSKKSQRRNSLDEYEKKMKAKAKMKNVKLPEKCVGPNSNSSDDDVSLDPATIASTVQSMRLNYRNGHEAMSPSNTEIITSPRRARTYPTEVMHKAANNDSYEEMEQKNRWRRGTVFLESPTESLEELRFDIRTTTGTEA